MGTFHSDRGELHGVTVVVDTDGAATWVGRCDTVTESGVLLHGADVHEANSEGPTREAWLGQVSKLGVWPRHDRVLVPAASVTAIRRLSDVG